jgi:eukaryotic-like serine/threonine-protein kinase
MSGAAADRNLLLGIIALQMDFISRDALIGAMNAWVLNKATPLCAILQDQGALTDSRRSLLDALIEEHLKLHENEAEKSLAALSSIGSVHDELSRIEDPELQASLPHLSAARDDREDDRGRSMASTVVGDSTSAGTRFRILRPHAKGGLGEVFVARDTELNRDVALKEIQSQFAFDARFRSRFEFEAEVTGGLEHPGIVPVYGLGHLPDGRPFYAMRFIRGYSLMEAIKRFHEAEKQPKRDPGLGTLELRELLGRFIDVCDAVAYAHSRGVLHRDLKPGNIMLGRYGETMVVDWGLAKSVDEVEPECPVERSELPLKPLSGNLLEPTIAGSAIGTPPYMSPEQVDGRLGKLGARTDVCCLGATLYHLLSGHAPFAGDQIGEVYQRILSGEFRRPRLVNVRLPLELESICLKAMALKPERRYPSTEALKADLERWLADEPVTACREPFARRARRWAKRNRTLVASGAATLVMAAMGLGVISVVQTKARNDLVAKNIALEHSRRRAEANESQAIDAVKKFTDAVANEPVLKENPDLDELRKRLLKEPLAYFRGLRERLEFDRDTRPESLCRLANAMHDYAHLTDEIGDVQDGLRAHDESLAIWRRLTAEHPAKAN